MKAFVSALVTIGLSLSALQSHAASWYSGSIDRIELTAIGEILLFVNSPAVNECGSRRVDYVNPNDSASKGMLAALLSWQAQGKDVQVYIVSCDGTAGLFSTIVNQ